MKLIIASDIHGSAFWCRKLLELVEQEQPEQLILLGDLLYHGPRNDLPKEYAPKSVIPMLSGLKDKIIAVTGACCTEMEGAAIAHAAFRNGIPFVIIRAISDKADNSAEMDYPVFEAIAARRCARVTMMMARSLGERDNG